MQTLLSVKVYCLSGTGNSLRVARRLEGWFTVNLFDLLYLYAPLFLSSAVFHWLLRIKQVNLLLTCTTFTRLYPRYHEPDTRLEDLGRADDRS